MHVTPGNVHDSMPYLSRLDRQIDRFGFDVKFAGLDAGYFTAALCKGLEERDVQGVMGYRRPTHKKGYFYKREYQFDAHNDEYICPAGERLIYSTTSREGYRQYHSNPEVCRHCEHLARCTKNAKYQKTVTRHVWEDCKDRANVYRLTEQGKAIYKRRKETVERSFADAKQLHGYRYARYRGLNKVQGQCLMAAAAQNIKKIAQMAT